MNGEFEKSGLYPLDVTWSNRNQKQWVIRDVRTLTNFHPREGLFTDAQLEDPAFLTIVAGAIRKSPEFKERLELATSPVFHGTYDPGAIFWAGISLKDGYVHVELEDGSEYVEAAFIIPPKSPDVQRSPAVHPKVAALLAARG